jgi:hypothetical protein
MTLGAGKYDDEATAVRTLLHAEGVILFVLEGDRGSGMSVQMSAIAALRIPTILRHVADEIERTGGPLAKQ